MGYRSTFVTNAACVEIPTWFLWKYDNIVHFSADYTRDELVLYPSFPIASKCEGKCYGMWSELVGDIQVLLQLAHLPYTITLVFLHEDGKMTHWTITADNMTMKDVSI